MRPRKNFQDKNRKPLSGVPVQKKFPHQSTEFLDLAGVKPAHLGIGPEPGKLALGVAPGFLLGLVDGFGQGEASLQMRRQLAVAQGFQGLDLRGIALSACRTSSSHPWASMASTRASMRR
jgi:hypothetical protein